MSGIRRVKLAKAYCRAAVSLFRCYARDRVLPHIFRVPKLPLTFVAWHGSAALAPSKAGPCFSHGWLALAPAPLTALQPLDDLVVDAVHCEAR